MRPVIPVVLAGGTGTRLWPLSRRLRPKQFLPLVGDRTMLQETYLRARELPVRIESPIVVCNEAHRFLVAEQLREVGALPRSIVLEPEGRNTAPAIAVAALLGMAAAGSANPAPRAPLIDAPEPTTARDGSESRGGSQAGPLLLVLPADHVIADAAAFAQAVRVGIEAASKGFLVTFGIIPDRAETGYGYLRKGDAGDESGAWFLLERFVEKPDAATAEHYVKSTDYLWNSGMFLFSADCYLWQLREHAPEIATACARAADEAVADNDFTRLGPAFLNSPSISIDYAVMERTRSAAVVPLGAGWSDVGSWPALRDILEQDTNGNVLRGDVIVENCRDCYVSSSDRLVAVVGAEGYVIVETADAILVMPQSEAQDVKRVVEALTAGVRREL